MTRDDWDDGVEFADEADDLVRSFTVIGEDIPTDLPAMEQIVEVLRPPSDAASDQMKVFSLCDDSRSVAELSALTALPLGATRVIVAQLMAKSAVQTQQVVSNDMTSDSRFLRRLRDLVINY